MVARAGQSAQRSAAPTLRRLDRRAFAAQTSTPRRCASIHADCPDSSDTTSALKLGLETTLPEVEPGAVLLAALPTNGSLDEVIDAVYRHNALALAFAAIAESMAASVDPRYGSSNGPVARRSTLQTHAWLSNTHEPERTASPSKLVGTTSASGGRGPIKRARTDVEAPSEVKPVVFELSDVKPSPAALTAAIEAHDAADGRASSDPTAPRRLLDRIGSSVPDRPRRSSAPPESNPRHELFAPLMTAIRSANSFRGGPPLKSQVGGLLRRETAIALGYPNQGALMAAASAAGLVELGRTPGLQGADTIRIIE